MLTAIVPIILSLLFLRLQVCISLLHKSHSGESFFLWETCILLKTVMDVQVYKIRYIKMGKKTQWQQWQVCIQNAQNMDIKLFSNQTNRDKAKENWVMDK